MRSEVRNAAKTLSEAIISDRWGKQIAAGSALTEPRQKDRSSQTTRITSEDINIARTRRPQPVRKIFVPCEPFRSAIRSCALIGFSSPIRASRARSRRPAGAHDLQSSAVLRLVEQVIESRQSRLPPGVTS